MIRLAVALLALSLAATAAERRFTVRVATAFERQPTSIDLKRAANMGLTDLPEPEYAVRVRRLGWDRYRVKVKTYRQILPSKSDVKRAIETQAEQSGYGGPFVVEVR